jgi:HIV Tat-specific factor 1
VLAYDVTLQSYDSDGWKEAGTIDVLREACSLWYYEEASTTTNEVKGPISTRELAKLYYQHDNNNSQQNTDMMIIAGNTRVYRNEQEGWTAIDQLENLQLAMQAFREVVDIQIPSDSWSTTMTAASAVSRQQQKQSHEGTDAAENNQSQGGSSSSSDGGVNTCAQVQVGGNSIAQMTFNNDDDDDDNDKDITTNQNNQQRQQQKNVADELEAFLSSTDHLAPHASNVNTNNDNDVDDQEEYESDGGTRYIRDKRSGNWIHEAFIMEQQQQQWERMTANGDTNNTSVNDAGTTNDASQRDNGNNTEATTTSTSTTNKKRKRKKPKFSAKSARNWIYVTGLPLDTTEEELGTYFSKVGIIDIDPESLKPKIKLYRHKKAKEEESGSSSSSSNGGGRNSSSSLGGLKGDASICYARPESVELALQILDENLFRDGAILSVQRAKFEQHGSTFDTDKSGGGGKGGKKRRIISESKRRVARLAAIQAVGWDESENGRIAGGLKGLRIIVLMNMFDPRELEHDEGDENDNDGTNDTRLRALEREIHTECEEIGTVEKITIFSKHHAGVVIVKFVKPNDASDAVKAFNGKVRGNGRKVEASFWDGTTDYTVVDVEKEEKEAEKRLDKFGDWLEEQELPEEFQLRVEGSD